MAGESPDKSVDEGVSGAAESAGSSAGSAAAAERDPRLSVFRPREAESGDRDPLKAAVAAWVATADSGEPDRPAKSGPSASGASDESEASESAKASGSVSAGSGSSGESEAPAEREGAAKSGGAGKSGDAAEPVAPEVSSRPATSDDSDDSEASGEPASTESEEPGSGSAKAERTGKPDAPREPAPAERETAAKSGGAGKSGDAAEPAAPEVSSGPTPSDDSADSDDSEASGEPASTESGSAKSGTSAKSAKPEEPAESPKAGKADGAGSSGWFAKSERPAASAKPASDAGSESAPSSERVDPRAPKPATDQRTAVFGVLKPASGSDSASGSGKAPSSAEAEDKVKPASGDQRTAVFGVVKPAADKADAKGEDKADVKADARAEEKAKPAAADQRTAVFGVVKPKPSAEPDPSGDSERTAVFRTVKPGSGSGSGSTTGQKPGGDPRSAPAKDAKPAAPEKDEAAADSERTAVFRAPKVDAPKVDAPKTDAPKTDAPKARPVPPHSVGGERASAFVPLRGDGPGPKQPPAPPKPAPEAPRVGLADAERTTQQPLPPKPPLDMLADLTNNPPPPPSPLRTTVRRFKIYAPIVVLLAVILAVVQLVRPLPEPKLKMTAKASYTFDGGSPTLPWPKEGQAAMAAAGLGTVGTFGEQKPVPIGSVAKTMTAYVILKNHPMKKGEKGQMIDIDKTAVEDGKKNTENESTVNTLKEGDKLSEYDALAAIMIPSANNVARLLARWDTGGDQEAFVKKMNDAAKEIGMTNTTYTDPSGLDATTVSTAEDQVKLGLKVVEMPELIAITKLVSWTDPYGTNWPNWNHLIPGNGALGIKTGSTTKAGGNLLFAAEKKVGKTNQLIVGAVLSQHGVPILDTAIGHSKNLMLATQKMLVNAPVVKKGDVVGYVDDGLGGHTPVIATGDVEAVGWPSLTVNIKLSDGGTKLPQTAKAGTEVGVLTVGEGASQVKVPVALKSELAAPGIGSKLTRVG